MAVKFIDDDFVAVREAPDPKSTRKATLVFGDAVEVLGESNGWTKVKILTYFDGQTEGFVKGQPPVRDAGVLKLSMVDVQQGDGLILETPAGKIVFVDGGDNKLFARHAAERFRHRQTSAANPLEVDALIITHGDADHFAGLSEIVRSETLTGTKKAKRLFIHAKRVFHNGLVKGPTSLPEKQQLGRTRDVNNWPFITDLFDDPRGQDAARTNEPFKEWGESLTHWDARGPIALKRLAHGMDEADVFDFLLEEHIRIELQGPFTENVPGPGGATTPALTFLRKPRRTAELHLETGTAGEGQPSSSHTINGHSVAFRLTYGNVRINFTGDLNQEGMARLRERLPLDELEAEILKVPHHGSHEFDFAALKAIRPVVAIISSGDESARKEYIHPRATLMAAVGMAMRGPTGILLCTELAAFFEARNEAYERKRLVDFFKKQKTKSFKGGAVAKILSGKEPLEGFPWSFFGFERTNFGIIHIRTDGERVLVFTHSGKKGLNEAYRFSVTLEQGERKVTFAPEVKTR